MDEIDTPDETRPLLSAIRGMLTCTYLHTCTPSQGSERERGWDGWGQEYGVGGRRTNHHVASGVGTAGHKDAIFPTFVGFPPF